MMKSILRLVIVLILFFLTNIKNENFISAQNTTTTTAAPTTTSTTTTTTTTIAPPPPVIIDPSLSSVKKLDNLFAEDKETYSNVIAMAIASGVVSAISGNPVSVMYVQRTNMVLSLCFPLVEERVAVMQFPFLQQFGTDPIEDRYVGTALYNMGAMIGLFVMFLALGFVMKSAKKYSIERAFHNLRFPGILFAIFIMLGGPSLYCAAGVCTTSSIALNIIISLIAIIFWGVVVLLLPVIVGKVFDAEYIITQSVESAQQEKMLALTGKKETVDSDDGSSRDSRSDKSSVEDNDGYRDQPATENEGAFANIFSKLREGIEGMRDNTVSGARAGSEATNNTKTSDDMYQMYDEELDQQEEDMKQLAASTVDVLRQMFHHVKRTGGDEEKLVAAVHGTGEWRDKKNEEDFLEDEEEDEPLSFMRRYGVLFDQFTKRNKFHGFIELFATFASCAVANLWFFSDHDQNCMFQCFTFMAIQFIVFVLLVRRNPYIAKMNHGYSMALLLLHFCGAMFFIIGVLNEHRNLVLAGYVFGILSVYMTAFRALLDLYLLIVSKISGARENWPAIQELTDLFLAAKDRRDKGQMMTGPELSNDRASARSGKSARSAASRRSARYTQQFGKNGIQLFFKMATDSDRFCASRAIPEEYHPFIMRPLPEPVVLVPEERRNAIREKMEKAAAKAKWEAALQQLNQETDMALQLQTVSAAEQFKEEEFDEATAAEKERQKREREQKEKDSKTVPKLVRELFQLGLKTKYEEADKKDKETAKIEDFFFRIDKKRSEKLAKTMESYSAERDIAMAVKKKKEKAEDAAAAAAEKAGTADSLKKKRRGEEDVDEAFSSWVQGDIAGMAAKAAQAEEEWSDSDDGKAGADGAAAAGTGEVKRMSVSQRRAEAIKKAKEEKKLREEKEAAAAAAAAENGTSGSGSTPAPTPTSAKKGVKFVSAPNDDDDLL